MPVAVETDFHQWALETAKALQDRDFKGVNWDRVAEEIQGLGISQESELESRLAQLMYHLLKIQHQPERDGGRSWHRSVRHQKQRIARLLSKQPSLKSLLALAETWADAYGDVFSLASAEKLPDSVVNRFPEECPFSPDILDC